MPLLALVPQSASAGSKTFVGFNGTYGNGRLVMTGAPTATCTAKYCARVKPGRARSITVSAMNLDPVTAEQLFAVGQDKNRDGDAYDSGEYKLACGSGTFAIRPRVNVDIQILAGEWRNGDSICISTPTVGTLTTRLR
ncbi:MAG TPA: hypothetical protein VGV67_10910, partial [Solirubrobacteraceae bacterium]|nr:hypothetical protein [Solirubrobacteraceae bacterium]